MEFELQDDGHQRLATLDIETTHYDAEQGETVSIGLGVHERGQPASEAEYTTLHRKPALDEGEMIRGAFTEVDDLDADALVTYKGTAFDFEFLNDRLQILGEDASPATIGEHVDLYPPRKKHADARGDKWPSLEECLQSYGHEPPTTIWNGKVVTNTRFGEELGPALLDSIRNDDQTQWEQLVDVIEHYLVTDLEANLAVYHGDIGADFEPHHLGQKGEFDV